MKRLREWQVICEIGEKFVIIRGNKSDRLPEYPDDEVYALVELGVDETAPESFALSWMYFPGFTEQEKVFAYLRNAALVIEKVKARHKAAQEVA